MKATTLGWIVIALVCVCGMARADAPAPTPPLAYHFTTATQWEVVTQTAMHNPAARAAGKADESGEEGEEALLYYTRLVLLESPKADPARGTTVALFVDAFRLTAAPFGEEPIHVVWADGKLAVDQGGRPLPASGPEQTEFSDLPKAPMFGAVAWLPVTPEGEFPSIPQLPEGLETAIPTCLLTTVLERIHPPLPVAAGDLSSPRPEGMLWRVDRVGQWNGRPVALLHRQMSIPAAAPAAPPAGKHSAASSPGRSALSVVEDNMAYFDEQAGQVLWARYTEKMADPGFNLATQTTVRNLTLYPFTTEPQLTQMEVHKS